MDWIVLEELDATSARLTALRLGDGSRRILFDSAQDAPLRASLHLDLRRAAVDVHTKSALHGAERARVALVNLEQVGKSWLRRSLDPRWRLSGLVFGPGGHRFAVEGNVGGAPSTDIYAFDLSLTAAAATEKLLGGVAHPQGLGCVRPAWLPDGDRFVYLQAGGNGWRLMLADLDRVGPADTTPGDRAPGIFTTALHPDVDLVPAAGLVPSPDGATVYGVARVGEQHQLVGLPLDGGAPFGVGGVHAAIARPAVGPDGQTLAFAADGRVWLSQGGRAPQVMAGESGDETHTGVCLSQDGEGLYFVTRAPHGVTLDVCDLVAGVPYPVAQLGAAQVVELHPVPERPALGVRLAERPEVVNDAPAFIEGATSITRLPKSARDTRAALLDGAVDDDTMINAGEADASPLDDDAPDSTVAGDLDETPDGTLAGDELEDDDEPEDATVDATAEALGVDVDGALGATAMHAPLAPPPGFEATLMHDALDDADGNQTAVHAIEPAPRAPTPKAHRAAAPLAPPPLAPAPLAPPPLAPAPLAPARPVQPAPAPRTVVEPPVVPGQRDPSPAPAAPPPSPRPAMPAVPAAPPPAPELEESVLEVSMSSLTDLDPDDPPEDFKAWMDRLPRAEDPGGQLAELERHIGDARLAVAAVSHLERALEAAHLEGEEATLPLIFAISAVAHLRIDAARPQLRALCRRALDRLEMQRAIPEAEEHFALAALRAIGDRAVPYAAMVVYENYQTILTKIAEAMAENGDIADRTRTFYLERFRQQLTEALSPTAAEEVDTAAREALELAAQQQLQRDLEAARRAAVEQRMAEQQAAAERQARADAARIAAAHVGARLAERASVADDEAEWSRRMAEVRQQGAPPSAPDPWAAAATRAREGATDGATDSATNDDPWAAAATRARESAPDSATNDDPWAAAQARANAAAEPADPWAAAAARARGDDDDQTMVQAAADARAAAEQEAARQAAARQEAARQAAQQEAAREEAARRAAQQEAARQEAARQEAARQEAARQEAARHAAEQEAARQEAARRAAARPAPPVDEWQQARAAAEGRAVTTSGDDWGRLKAEAEVAARVAAVNRIQRAQTAQVTPAEANPFGLAPASPERPAIREPRRAPPGTLRVESSLPGAFDESWGGSAEWDQSAVGAAAGPPKALSAIAVAGVIAGITIALLGVKIGGAFIGFGALWTVAGIALIGDKRPNWLFALGAYFANAVFLVAYAFAGELPVWIPAAGLAAGGVAGALAAAGLLHPVFRQRYRPGRTRF